MREIEYCQCCGQKIVTYKHKLNKGLCSCLIKFLNIGGEGKLKDMNLTNNEFGNFQKLAYFGLVRREGTNWIMTEKGKRFILGEDTAPSEVYTKNNQVVDKGSEIYRYQIKGWYELKEEWQDQASIC